MFYKLSDVIFKECISLNLNILFFEGDFAEFGSNFKESLGLI
jgi:hypothetical protein